MKKIALFVIATVALLSCKKDYVCTCKMHLEATGFPSVDSTYTIDLKKQKKKDAKSQCDANETSTSASYLGIAYSQTTTCDL